MVDLSAFKIGIDNARSANSNNYIDPRAAFMAELQAAGFGVPKNLLIGALFRVDDPQDKTGGESGWGIYHEYPDQYNAGQVFAIGIFGSWHGNPDKVVWKSRPDHLMTTVERTQCREAIERARAAQETEKKILQAEAAIEVKAIHGPAAPLMVHPYTTRKGNKVLPGLKLHEGNIIVPLYSGDDLMSLEYISPSGDKWVHPNGRVKGCYFPIKGTQETVYIVEGVSTGASVAEATGATVYVARNAGNLYEVTDAVKKMHPQSRIVIAGDDDCGNKVNIGRDKATQAAEALSVEAIFPVGVKDFNDYAVANGLPALKELLTKRLTDSHPMPLNLFPDALDTPPQYSPEDYPKIIADLTNDISTRMGTDPVIAAWTAIAVAAALIHDEIKIQVKAHDTDWRESARPWIALVGEPSTKKSPPMAAVLAPLNKVQAEWHKEWGAKMESWKKQITEAKNLDLPPPIMPQPRKKYVNDTTIEALGNILEHNDGGVLAVHDELTGWFASMDCYRQKGGMSKDRSAYLTAYNGGPLFIDRATQGPRYIPNFSVSLIGGIQPGPMRKIASGFGDDGLLQRIIPLLIRPATNGTDVAPDAAAKEAWDSLCRNLSEMRVLT
jgi:hypothetical protein